MSQPKIVGTQATYWTLLPSTPVDLSTSGFVEVSIPYASLVPSGYTSNITINQASLLAEGIWLPNKGIVSLVIEAPANSGEWKRLCFLYDGTPDQQRTETPNVVMTSNDEICLQISNHAYPAAGESAFFGLSSWNRQVIVTLSYTVP